MCPVANLRHVFTDHGMVDDTKQIRKSCNLCHLFCCGMVNNDEFSIIFCNCLRMVNDTKIMWVTHYCEHAQAHPNQFTRPYTGMPTYDSFWLLLIV